MKTMTRREAVERLSMTETNNIRKIMLLRPPKHVMEACVNELYNRKQLFMLDMDVAKKYEGADA